MVGSGVMATIDPSARIATTDETAPGDSRIPARLTLPGPFRAVCFDLDGLLVDTEVIWMEAKRILFEGYGVSFDHSDHLAVFGTSEMQTATYFAGRLGQPAETAPGIGEQYRAIVSRLMEGTIALRPGATELVASLRGRVPIAVATNTRRSIAEVILRRSGLAGSFDAVVTGDEEPPKPAPDVYLAACRALGVAPSEAVGLEDSPTGVIAVKAAGMTCIAVPSDPTTDVSTADRIVPSLLDLIEVPAP
jgi:HAD superfamily hydrolase (TIGR01509 family)